MQTWKNLTDRLTELDALAGALAVLEWDQQCYLPPGGGNARAGQSATLGRIFHERFTDPAVGEWLDVLEGADLDATQRAAVVQVRRKYRRATVVPTRLVEDLAKARADGFAAWLEAKGKDDFTPFAGPLQRLIDLTREQAALYADGAAHPYDALLEDYDPGSTVAELRPMFTRLKVELGTLLDTLDGRPHPGGPIPEVDTDGLRRLSDRLLRDLGFDLTRGRLDLAEHPFSTNLGVGDVRLTTHLHPENLLATLGGTIHECGHGMYEHQSRFWENFIGRSLPFCRYLVPRMQGIWPSLALTPEALFGTANRVERSLIRIFADEATYNLHIIVRFDLELQVLEGKLEAKDLPEAWNEGYRSTVGVVAPSAKQGVLQDVHWSSGLFGYFPSYTIGNLYAASLGAKLVEEMPDVWRQVERGDFRDVLQWLRTKVHQKGAIADAPIVFKEAVGDRDPVEDLVSHLWSRQGRLYGVERPR
jgi:carboxypeptidase Taq